MVIEDYLCEELYIIGYSFRDEHINKAIADRCKISRRKENPKPFKIVIVDYANDDATKLEFITRVNTALEIPKKHAFEVDDENILFGGANSIKNILVSY
jgi:hypothetical protein